MPTSDSQIDPAEFPQEWKDLLAAADRFDPRRPRTEQPKGELGPPLFSEWKEAKASLSIKDLPAEAWWPLDWIRLSNGEGKPPPSDFDPWHTPLSRELYDLDAQRFNAVALAQEILLNKTLINAKPAYALYAIKLVLCAGLTAPDWLVKLYARGIDELSLLKTGSIDVAFNHQPPTSRSLYAFRDARDLSWTIWFKVFRRALRGQGIGVPMFEEIGDEIGIGKDLAQKAYWLAVKGGWPNVANWMKAFRKRLGRSTLPSTKMKSRQPE